MASVMTFAGKTPQIDDSVFLASSAVVIGDVVLGKNASVWYGAVLRGDQGFIHVGAGTNIQDNVVIHADTEEGTVLADRVTVGHGAVLHDVHVGAGSVIGMNATLLHGARIGEECMIGAGAVLRESFEVPARSVVVGIPGRVVKKLEGSAAKWLEASWEEYVELVERYRESGIA